MVIVHEEKIQAQEQAESRVRAVGAERDFYFVAFKVGTSMEMKWMAPFGP